MRSAATLLHIKGVSGCIMCLCMPAIDDLPRIFGIVLVQAKRQSAAPGSIAAQVGMLSVGQPPLEAAPTPQGYAQRQAVMKGQNHNQAQGLMEAAIGGQDNGLVQPLMDPSRSRTTEMDGIADDVGGVGGLSDLQKQPLKLSQVRVLCVEACVKASSGCLRLLLRISAS